MKQQFKILGVLGLLFLCSYTLNAQSTIGSQKEPNKGALLDLKENENVDANASKGLLLPRVNLEDVNELYPMFEEGSTDYTDTEKDKHTGLIVYNLTDREEDGLTPGIFVWEGRKWIKVRTSSL